MSERPQHGVHARALLATGVAFAIVLVVIGVLVRALAGHWQAVEAPRAPPDMMIDGPALTAAPEDERSRYEAQKHALAESYAWIDRDRGIARIPVDVAMDLLTVRGSASRKKGGRAGGAATKEPARP
jgi:hypothetical protein